MLVTPGWLTVYGKEAQDEDAANLAPVKPNETVKTTAIEVKPNVDQAPAALFGGETLLSAMEGAGRSYSSRTMNSARPCTRKVCGHTGHARGHHRRPDLRAVCAPQRARVAATAKAFSLMELLNGLGIAELTKPELTGDWELKLHQIQRRQKSRDEFMSEIADMTRHIVERAKKYEHDTIPGDFGVLKTPCPKCGGEVHEKYKQFQCEKCDFAIWKTVAGRMFEIEEVENSSPRNESAPAGVPQQDGQAVRRRVENERRVQGGI